VRNQPIYPSFYYRGCFYGCNSVYGAFGLLIKAENSDLPEGWENSTHSILLQQPGIWGGALVATSKVINTFAARFKRRFSTSKSSSGSSVGDTGNSLIIDICVAVIEIIEVFLPWLN
jgi:hypothetical protein